MGAEPGVVDMLSGGRNTRRYNVDLFTRQV